MNKNLKLKLGKRTMEFEDAPSGYVNLYNYKEPFMLFQEGYGYQGVLLFDGDTDQIQCHICGNWYENLISHISSQHRLNARAYKIKVGLGIGTALINETTRDKLVRSGMKKRLKNLVNQIGIHRSEATKNKIRAARLLNSIEDKNKLDTCPEQLINRLKKMAEKLGYTPTSEEVTFYDTIVTTYGTYNEACRIAGLPIRKPSVTKTSEMKRKYFEVNAVKFIRKFFANFKRLPELEDYRRFGKKMYYDRMMREKRRKEIEREAITGHFEYDFGERYQFNENTLLELLKNFEKIHNRKPSYSDCKRKLLPNLQTYHYHFGSWKEALSLAGIEQ